MSQKNVVAQLQRQISESLDVEKDLSFSEMTGLCVNTHAGQEWEDPEPDDPNFDMPYISVRTDYRKYPRKEVPDPQIMNAAAYFESINKYPEIEEKMLDELKQRYVGSRFRRYFERFHNWLEDVKVSPPTASLHMKIECSRQNQNQNQTTPTPTTSSMSTTICTQSQSYANNYAIRAFPTSQSALRQADLMFVNPPPGFAPLFPSSLYCNKSGQVYASSGNPEDRPVDLPVGILEDIEREASRGLEKVQQFVVTQPDQTPSCPCCTTMTMATIASARPKPRDFHFANNSIVEFDEENEDIIQGIERLLESDDEDYKIEEEELELNVEIVEEDVEK